MLDTLKHQGLRKQLIEVVRTKGIKDEKVLEAMMRVPRHFFLDSTFLQFAYDDKAFPIGAGQTISQPYTVAFQTELLNLSRGDKVLEIGTGSGYQTSVLCELGVKVFSIERQRSLFNKTRELLEQMKYTARLFFGDGYKGLPAFAPFDKILITCGAPFVPEMLLQQMKTGAVMVIPIGEGSLQSMTRIIKVSDNKFERSTHGSFRFVPMLEDRERNGA